MANHPSAERRNRQRIKKTARNRSIKSSVRTELKKARAAIQSGVEDVQALVRTVESKLDKAATKGVMHARSVARAKARLYRRLHAATKPAAT